MEEYINGLAVKLEKIIDKSQLDKVMQIIRTFSSDFEITKRSAELAEYDNTPEYYKAFLVSKKIEGMKDGSLKLYSTYIKEFFEYIDKRASDVTPNDVRVYLYKIQDGRNISNRTLDSRRSILSSFFEWLANEGYIGNNPVRSIKPIKYSSEPRKPLNGVELELVRNAASTLRERAIIEFLYSTGCRVSELCKVKISDIDFNKHEVILFGKGSKYRTSYINARCEVSLQKYLSSRKDNNIYAFVSDRKPYSNISRRNVERIVADIGTKSGISRPLFPHLLRHTMATDGLSRGIDVSEIQKTLGHTNVNTTLIYSHVDFEKAKAEHLRLIV